MDYGTCLQVLGGGAAIYLATKAVKVVLTGAAFVLQPQPPSVSVDIKEEEDAEILHNHKKFDLKLLDTDRDVVHLWDPSTLDYFGSVKAMGKEEVTAAVHRAREAQNAWKKSSFSTRRLLMRTMQRYITENQERCARVAVRESGKTLLDALIGEVLVTCEKLAWLADHGEK